MERRRERRRGLGVEDGAVSFFLDLEYGGRSEANK